MILDLANLGLTAKLIDVEFGPAEIDLEGERIVLTGKVRLDGEIQHVDARVQLQGNINAEVSFDCTRCLLPVEKLLRFPFRAVFVESSLDETTAEAEISAEDLDESLIYDGQVDLAEVVREQLLLALPEQVFCREDCNGLCPKCGSDLNLKDCKCADDEFDPRWAALKELK